MRDNIHRSMKFRNPNKNIWVCPFCSPHTNTMDTRGAPAHIRNKHGLSWKKEYLEKPELLIDTWSLHSKQEDHIRIKELFSDSEIRDKRIAKRVLIQIYYLIKMIKKAIKQNDYSQLHEINKRLIALIFRE